jgi:DNA-directed RNA polymerase specialized sigma24 family protein
LSEQRDFDDFYRACREEMARALVLTVGHRDLGREATDEAFARAFESWADVGGYKNPDGWVYRVGVDWARSRLRRRSFTMAGMFAESVHLDDLPEPELLFSAWAINPEVELYELIFSDGSNAQMEPNRGHVIFAWRNTKQLADIRLDDASPEVQQAVGDYVSGLPHAPCD